MRRATLRKAVKDGQQIISIHALHEESDTEVAIAPDTAATISIHALHEESDVVSQTQTFVGADISIHALHEESDWYAIISNRHTILFQSTLSMRRATTRSEQQDDIPDFNPRSP